MSLKPLPYRFKKKARKILLFVSIVFGLLFGGSLTAFISLAANVKNDVIIENINGAPKSLKKTEDGFIYSTTDNYLIYQDFSGEVLSKTNLFDILPEDNARGTLSAITSINYASQSKRLYLTCRFKKNSDQFSEYLFILNHESDDTFSYDEEATYVEVDAPLSQIVEHGHYLYCTMREGEYGRLKQYDTNDLSRDALQEATLCSESFLYDDDFDIAGFSYEPLTNPTVHILDYIEGRLLLIINSEVLSIAEDALDEFDRITGFNVETSTPAETKAQYQKMVTFSYDATMAHGAIEIDEEYYIVTDSREMMHFSKASLKVDEAMLVDSLLEVESLYVDKTTVKGFAFDEPTPSSRQSFYYDDQAKTAVIIPNLGTTLTYVDMRDLDNIHTIFVDQAESNIGDVVITPDGQSIYYLCQNTEVTGDSLNMLKLKDVASSLANIKFGRIIPVFLVLTIITLILFVLTLLCAVKAMFLEKTLAFFKNVSKNWVAYLILALCLTLLGLFCYYPATGSIIMSFFNYKNNQPIVWNNFANYILIFTDPDILKAFVYMILFLIVDVITAIIPPLIFAFFLTVMKNKKVSAVTRTLLFLPSVIPGITKLMIWQEGMYGQYGLFNIIDRLFGGTGQIRFLAGPQQFWSLILMGFPFVGSYLVFYGALMNVPSSYYEAAELEGLNVWKRFFQIDIPLIKPQIKYVLVLTIIASVQNFSRTYMITESGFELKTPIHIMFERIGRGDYGVSSAIAAVLFVVLIGFTLLSFRRQKGQLGDVN